MASFIWRMVESFTPGRRRRFSYRPSNKCAFHILPPARIFHSFSRPRRRHVNVLFILDFPRTNVFTPVADYRRRPPARAREYDGRLPTTVRPYYPFDTYRDRSVHTSPIDAIPRCTWFSDTKSVFGRFWKPVLNIITRDSQTSVLHSSTRVFSTVYFSLSVFQR